MNSAPTHFYLPRQPRRPFPNSPLHDKPAQHSSRVPQHGPGDFRRPRSIYAHGNLSPASRPASSVPSLTTGPSARDSGSDYNDLYDVSDDESALVPIKVSNSVKQYLSRNDMRRESLPSLVIPSPTAWPTIEKLQKAARAPKSAPLVSKMPNSSPRMPLSPTALAKLGVTANLRVPAVNATPSLDGSLTSDEIASMSPSTPDLRSLLQEDGWEMPMQLNPQAMATLQHLSPDFNADLGPIVEVPETPPGEMQERGLNIHLLSPPISQPTPLPQSEPVSAISLPSPGGFLASLPAVARQAWALPDPTHSDQPNTATAEGFYDIPWESRSNNVVERTVEIGHENETDGPPTARQEDFSHKPEQEMVVKPRAYEYDEEYEKKLYETAASNKNRTSMWLSAQENYLSALKDNNPANAEEPSPRLSQAETLSPNSSPDAFAKSPSTTTAEIFTSPKKAVRFAENSAKTPVTAVHSLTDGRSDPLFYHAFQHLVYGSRPSDAFDLAQIRADAVQAQRRYLSEDHWQQLRGSYKLSSPRKPEKDFAHLPNAPNDPAVQKQREAIGQADRERQALTQLSLAHWHLEASRMLSGGSLLSRSVRESIDSARKAGRTPRILDLGGTPVGDWGWAVALQERDAKVYTAVVSAAPQSPNGTEPTPRQRGPSNHRVKSVANSWTLPFPTGSVDVVSARSLHALCRTRKPSLDSIISPHGDFEFPFAAGLSAHPRAADDGTGNTKDEYAATLAEIRRILAPGGVFHYHLLDAEMGGAPSTLQARSVEFAVALRAQGFDSAAGHHSQRRLLDAGFAAENVSENWVELPVGGSAPGGTDIANVTELVGAVAWERWMLATRGEAPMRSVAQALDAARKADERLSWKLLVGIARR